MRWRSATCADATDRTRRVSHAGSDASSSAGVGPPTSPRRHDQEAGVRDPCHSTSRRGRGSAPSKRCSTTRTTTSSAPSSRTSAKLTAFRTTINDFCDLPALDGDPDFTDARGPPRPHELTHWFGDVGSDSRRAASTPGSQDRVTGAGSRLAPPPPLGSPATIAEIEALHAFGNDPRPARAPRHVHPADGRRTRPLAGRGPTRASGGSSTTATSRASCGRRSGPRYRVALGITDARASHHVGTSISRSSGSAASPGSRAGSRGTSRPARRSSAA